MDKLTFTPLAAYKRQTFEQVVGVDESPAVQPKSASFSRYRCKVKGRLSPITSSLQSTTRYSVVDSAGQTDLLTCQARVILEEGDPDLKGRDYLYGRNLVSSLDEMSDCVTRIDDPGRTPTVDELIRRETRRLQRWSKRRTEALDKFTKKEEKRAKAWQEYESARALRWSRKYDTLLKSPWSLGTKRRDAQLNYFASKAVERPYKRRQFRLKHYVFRWYDMINHTALVPCALKRTTERYHSHNPCFHAKTRKPSPLVVSFSKTEHTTEEPMPGYVYTVDRDNTGDIGFIPELGNGPDGNTPRMELTDVPIDKVRSAVASALPKVEKKLDLFVVAAKWRQRLATFSSFVNSVKEAANAGVALVRAINHAGRVSRQLDLAASRALKQLITTVRKSTRPTTLEQMKAKALLIAAKQAKSNRLKAYIAEARAASNLYLSQHYGVRLGLRDFNAALKDLSLFVRGDKPAELKRLIERRGNVVTVSRLINVERSDQDSSSGLTPTVSVPGSCYSLSENSYVQTDYSWSYGPDSGSSQYTEPFDLSALVGSSEATRKWQELCHCSQSKVRKQRIALSCSYDFVDKFGWKIDDSIVYRGALLDRYGINANFEAIWVAIPYSFIVDWFVGVQESLRKLNIPWTRPTVCIENLSINEKISEINAFSAVAGRGSDEWSDLTSRTVTSWTVKAPGKSYSVSYFRRRPLPLSVVESLPTIDSVRLSAPGWRQAITGLALRLQKV